MDGLCIQVDQCEVDALTEGSTKLRATIAAAVRNVAGVQLATVQPAFEGKACNGDPEQINCVAADPQTVFVPPNGVYLNLGSATAESFHPNSAGQDAYYDVAKTKV